MSIREPIETKDVYCAALLGGLSGYVGLVLLVALSALIGTADLVQAGGVLILGLLFWFIPAAFISAVVVAPIGVFIGLKALGWLSQSRWHGALTGALTAFTITLALAAFFSKEWRETPDMGTIVFLASALGIAALAGWLTQHRFLRAAARA